MATGPTDPAVTVNFGVRIDGHDLGSFTRCEGLSLEVEIETREEGGNNGFVHQLPGRMRYAHITLTRPLNQDSQRLAQWFAAMRTPIRRTDAEISARTLDGQVVATWSLTGVIPVKWTGPELSTDSPGVATETLELAHNGFLDNA